MHVEEFSKRMIELMPRFVRGMARQESNYLTQGKITIPQFWTLEYLSRQKGCLMSELADYIDVSRPAATGLIDRLIKQGLVKREVVPDDRREVWVNITSKGQGIVSHIQNQKRRALEQIFSKISSRERKQYLIILERVAGFLREQPVKEGKKP